MTIHCCQLIVDVKYIIVNDYCLKHNLDAGKYNGQNNAHRFRKALVKHLDYPDVGRVVFGTWGAGLVKLFLFLTQCGFCINYHIFIGTMLYGMVHSPSAGSTHSIQRLEAYNSNNGFGDAFHNNAFVVVHNSSSGNTSGGIGHTFSNTPIVNSTPFVVDNFSTSSLSDVTTSIPAPSGDPWLPPLTLLVVAPLPLFLVFVLLRKVRNMAPISLTANSAATIGFVLTIGYIISGMETEP